MYPCPVPFEHNLAISRTLKVFDRLTSSILIKICLQTPNLLAGNKVSIRPCLFPSLYKHVYFLSLQRNIEHDKDPTVLVLLLE